MGTVITIVIIAVIAAMYFSRRKAKTPGTITGETKDPYK